MPLISAKFDDALLARVGATSPADFEASLTAFLDAQPGKLATAKAEGESAGSASLAALAGRFDAMDARLKAVEAKPATTFDAAEVTKAANSAAALKVAEILAANGGKPLAPATEGAQDSTGSADFKALMDAKMKSGASKAAAFTAAMKEQPDLYAAWREAGFGTL